MKINGFKLSTVIIIIVVTSIISAVTTGVILNSVYQNISGISYYDILEDESLSEFLTVYTEIKNNFYGDYDEEGMLDEGIDALIGYTGTSNDEAIDLALESMLSYLGDDYTTFLDSNSSAYLSSELSATYEGIGITISGNTIISVTKGSPADESGLMINDVIVSINGEKIDNYYNYYITYLISNATDDINIVVLRDGIEKNITTYKTTLDSSTKYYMLDDTNIGYISLSVFSEKSFDSFNNALTDLESQGMTSLVIDLRDNGGGYLDKAIEIASLFLEKGKTINSLVSNDGKTYNYDETLEFRDYPIILLINDNTASASEILATALIDNQKAKSVGVQSYGKGTVQELIESSTGTAAKYTTAYWYTPNEICINKIGIEPDYYVEIEYLYDETGEISSTIDSQLYKAVEILTEA